MSTERATIAAQALDIARALTVAAPAWLLVAWTVAYDAPLPRGALPAVLGAALGASVLVAAARSHTRARRLRTISAVLASYRDGDFSTRPRRGHDDAALDDVFAELSELGDRLRSSRLAEIEAWGLLRAVMAEVDVAVLAFDDAGRVHLANDAAARLLGKPSAAIVGKPAAALGLSDVLSGPAPRVVADASFHGAGPWALRRGAFRMSGRAHALVILSDVGSALREKEREAWQRLIRVLGHEINNSLTPICSISRTLADGAARPQDERSPEWNASLAEGLGVIARRAEALGRFTASYATLARLPPPRLAKVEIEALVQRIAALETRRPIAIEGGPASFVVGDADQLEQVLLNLLKNAVEAAAAFDGGVRIGWSQSPDAVELTIDDDGPGVSDTANLFVPFFTTKPDGSGIGLVLCRQIVEAHRGELTLASRTDGRGARAVMRLRRAPLE